ncbi:MAG: multiheme c-type cytochrome, partial [Planctomycetota bacterium]
MYAPRASTAALLLVLLLTPATIWPSERSATRGARFVKSHEYWPSSQCRSCHASICEQQLQSMHARSFTNPVFQAQYFEELLPKVEMNSRLRRDASGCIACHAPVAYILRKGNVATREDV